MTGIQEAEFLFAYVARRPKSFKEAAMLPAVKRQLALLQSYKKEVHAFNSKPFWLTTTYRPAVFTETATFRDAVEWAVTNTVRIVVADLGELLIRAPASKLSDCMARLDSLPCEVYDVISGLEWRAFSTIQRAMIIGARAAKLKADRAISQGRRANGPSDANLTANQSAGARSNKRKAARSAERLREVVETFRTTQAGGVISPSALMHHLNDLGIKPPRADRWSGKTTKRLLDRLTAQEHTDTAS